MSYGTIIQQGRFVADGNVKVIQLRSDVDWMQVINFTEATAQNNGHGFRYSWYRGMALNDGFIEYHPAADHTAAIDTAVNAAVAGFKLVDTSVTTPSAPIAETAITDVVAPVISTATTTGISVGSIVRLSNDAGQPNTMGIDFQVGAITPGVNFTVAYNLANAPGAAGTGGFYRIIANDAIFYPKRRTVCNVTAAANAVITTTVSNGFTVGQKVRFKVPAVCGMIELDGLQGTVVATAAGSFTVDIDTTAFTAFAWPAIASVPFTPAEVIPVGEDSVVAPNGLGDATENQAYIGMILGAGVLSPAGSNTDVIYWVAGKSENL
jgi:hypothetical protein